MLLVPDMGRREDLEIATMTSIRTNDDGLTFDEWCEKANTYLMNTVGISTLEIADWDWYNGWLDGMSPEGAAEQAFADDDLGALFLDLLDGEAGQTF
jgi:hypothetical protein